MTTADDYACKCGCGENWICSRLPIEINRLERLLNWEYGKVKAHISSGYRCLKHNAAVGGKPLSYHPKGSAVDVHFTTNGIVIPPARIAYLIRAIQQLPLDIFHFGCIIVMTNSLHLDLRTEELNGKRLPNGKYEYDVDFAGLMAGHQGDDLPS